MENQPEYTILCHVGRFIPLACCLFTGRRRDKMVQSYMPNAFAYLVFYSWPLVVYLIFRKQPLVPALTWSMVLGLILLPSRVGFDLPAFPTIGKYQIITISTAVMCFIKARQDSRPKQWKTTVEGADAAPTRYARIRRSRANWIVWALLFLAVAVPIFTVLSNPDPIIAGPRFIPGLRLYDAISVIGAAVFTLLPFVLGRRFLDTPDSHVILLKVLCYAMLGYSLLALWEVRMSPQLNRYIYGFVSSSFLQHMRAGGFRPLVFFNHGLALGIFLSMSVLSAFTLWRYMKTKAAGASIWIVFAGWLLFTLVLSKTVGALMITLTLVPVIILTKTRGQLLLAATLSAVVLFYPMLRGAGYIPTEAVYEFVLERDPNRAQSFRYRLDNEDSLLAKANQRPVLGWGTWGRNHIFDEDTGVQLSVTDGAWIIIIGSFGWLGYIASFGLLTVPPILLAIARRRLDISVATSGLALVLSANLVDLLPNAALTPVTWLLAGALMGRLIHASETTVQLQARQGGETRIDPVPVSASTADVIKRVRRTSVMKPCDPDASTVEKVGSKQRQKRKR